MTLGEARAAWPDKVLWFNYPSALHHKSDPEIHKSVVDMLDELPNADGVIMAVTEDVPADRRRTAFPALRDGLSSTPASGRRCTDKCGFSTHRGTHGIYLENCSCISFEIE
jgi:hypothetical protein